MRQLTMTIAIFFASLAGCNRQATVEQASNNYSAVEVYYRNFSSLAPVSYSRNDLTDFAEVKFRLDDQKAVARLNKIIPAQCAEAHEPTKSSLDYYLIIRFFAAGELKKELSASHLHFIQNGSAPGRMCRLSARDRERLADWIETHAPKNRG